MAQVLVVDGDAGTRHVVQSHLEDAGYDVVLAAGGNEGLAKAKSQSPDLIILSYDTLPDMEVCGFVEPIIKDPLTREASLIALFHARVRQDARVECFGGALDAYLELPERLPELVPFVRKALSMEYRLQRRKRLSQT